MEFTESVAYDVRDDARFQLYVSIRYSKLSVVSDMWSNAVQLF